MFQQQARAEFDQAKRKAFWNQFLRGLEGAQDELLDFNEISQNLHLKTAVYRGRQVIPLDKIVGSVGRYKDFTGAFLPVSDDMRERWQRVATLYLDPTSSGAPPIEAYKVGDSYFVKDGNHRVSVANQLGMEDIEAYVWEYPDIAGLDAGADIDSLLIEAERQDFLAKTRLDELRPGHDIRVTEPGGYTELLRQIAQYQKALSKIDGEPVSYEAAVTAWYDMKYETTLVLIKEAGVLDLFTDRTPADFYVWVSRYLAQLQERYSRRIQIKDIAREIPQQQRPGCLSRVWRGLLRLLIRLIVG